MKTYQFLLLFLAVLFVGSFQFAILQQLQHPQVSAPVKLGIAQTELGYKTVTNSSSTCSNGTSTLVIGKDPARTSFTATVNTSTAAYLCKGATCTAGTGIYLSATGGAYEQTDGYIGDYSCIGSGATSSLSQTSSL